MQLSNIQAEARAISWTRVSKNFKAISVGQAGVWGVGTNNKIYYREETYHPNVEEKGSRGGDWQLIGESDNFLSKSIIESRNYVKMYNLQVEA